jgi:hypothetical protein
MELRKMFASRSGQMVVLTTLAFVLLCVFIGLAIDLGRAYLLRSQLSAIVDASALAAAKKLNGQVGNQGEALKAACDAMVMNGMKVRVEGEGDTATCSSTSETSFTLSVDFVDKPVPGSTPIKFVQITGNASIPTSFLRLLRFMSEGNFTALNVSAFAEAGPVRPVDLMLVLDRSTSMERTDGSGRRKIDALKCALTGFGCAGDGFLDLGFSEIDQLGMTAFGKRGCGTGGNNEFKGDVCVADRPLGSAISDIKSAIDALGLSGTTNTMEGLRTAKDEISKSITDPARARSRKVVLLVTDGQPTALRRDSITECESDPVTGILLGGPSWADGNGCYFVKRGNSTNPAVSDGLTRYRLNTNCEQRFVSPTISDSDPCRVTVSGSGVPNTLYRHQMAAARNAARDEAHQIRELGGGSVVIFAIAIGEPTNPDATAKLDANARCLLAQIANDEALIESPSGSRGSGSCASVYETPDGDQHDDLTPAAFDPSQQEGKVFEVDLDGDVEAQLQLIFNQIAALLKLRLTI